LFFNFLIIEIYVCTFKNIVNKIITKNNKNIDAKRKQKRKKKTKKKKKIYN